MGRPLRASRQEIGKCDIHIYIYKAVNTRSILRISTEAAAAAARTNYACFVLFLSILHVVNK